MEQNKRTVGMALLVITLILVLAGGWYLYEANRNPWVFMGESNGFRQYIDEKTIKIQNNFLEFSLLSDKVVKDSAVTHVILHVQVSPDGKKIRVIKGDTYYRDGEVKSETANQKWMPLPPDSTMAQAARYGWTKAK